MNTENLIEEVYSAGAWLEVNGGNLVIKREGGPLSDHLIDELLQHKAEVISTLREGQTGQPFEAGEYPDVVLGDERYPYNIVGERVLFLLKGTVELCLAKPDAVFVEGTVLSHRFLGFTRKGRIPEYEVQVKTDDGQVYVRRAVEDYISEVR